MRLLDIDTAAERIGCSDYHVYTLVGAGTLRRFNISAVPGGTKTRVADVDIAAFMGTELAETEPRGSLTRVEVAERLSCSPPHINALRNAGKLHGFPFGVDGRVKFTPAEVDAYIANCEMPIPMRDAA